MRRSRFSSAPAPSSLPASTAGLASGAFFSVSAAGFASGVFLGVSAAGFTSVVFLELSTAGLTSGAFLAGSGSSAAPPEGEAVTTTRQPSRARHAIFRTDHHCVELFIGVVLSNKRTHEGVQPRLW